MSLLGTTHSVDSEEAMASLASQFSLMLNKPAVVTLSGELGAGKSVFARSLIHSLGFAGAVKSPTYTLVETYRTSDWRIAHMDLYRVVDPEELQFIGIRDIVAGNDLLLIEWPEKGGGQLPNSTYEVNITYSAAGRDVHFSSAL